MSERKQAKSSTAGFKESAVKLAVESKRPLTQTARELGASKDTLYGWVRQYHGNPQAGLESLNSEHLYVSDITYVATGEGWLYLAVFLDLYSRQVVGWAMSAWMTADLVVDALQMAHCRRFRFLVELETPPTGSCGQDPRRSASEHQQTRSEEQPTPSEWLFTLQPKGRGHRHRRRILSPQGSP